MTAADNIDPLAHEILSRLQGHAPAAEIVLGGYFALQHYLPAYRVTHDIDAWWKSRAEPAAEQLIRNEMKSVANEHGLDLSERRFGEIMSFELSQAGKRRFSFQIAVRSVGLEPARPSPWPPVLIETLADNVGSKMNALVDRGSPRDFTDIKQVVDAGLMTIEQCWDLWRRKNANAPREVARQNVMLHLARLEARRPLNSIADPHERANVTATRQWIRHQLLHG